MTNPQDLVAVLLPRELASEIERTPKGLSMGGARQVQVINACRQALSNPSVTVEGKVLFDEWYGEKILIGTWNNVTEGPCTVTITPKGGQSGE